MFIKRAKMKDLMQTLQRADWQIMQLNRQIRELKKDLAAYKAAETENR